ncbi:MAG: DedA family protein, partial [Anaerolineaceae bacterium]|nr:DedA family protein [Anaerolineaceae bacterium]
MDLGAILDAIKIWVEGVIQVMGYPGLVLVMFLENVFPPIPSEVVLPLAGNLTHTTSFTIFWVIFWGMIGSLLGAFLFYFLGKWFKEERVYWLVEKVGKYALIKTDDLDHAFEFFEKYGEWTIFFGRMVPIVRSLISIPAGLAEMNLIKFTIYSILGSSLWNLVLVMGGRLLGPQWPRIIEWVGIYQDVVIYLSIAAVV